MKVTALQCGVRTGGSRKGPFLNILAGCPTSEIVEKQSSLLAATREKYFDHVVLCTLPSLFHVKLWEALEIIAHWKQLQLSASPARPSECAFLFTKHPSVGLPVTQRIKVSTPTASWLKYLCNYSSMKHRILTSANIRLKSHIPVSCPSIATLGTFLLCCAPLFSPPSGVIRPRGNHRNLQRQHTLPREWASTLCLKGLQSIIPTGYGHQVKGQKDRSPGAVDKSPPALGSSPSVYFLHQPVSWGPGTKGQGQFSQPANSYPAWL